MLQCEICTSFYATFPWLYQNCNPDMSADAKCNVTMKLDWPRH